jgi:hypothetical protein
MLFNGTACLIKPRVGVSLLENTTAQNNSHRVRDGEAVTRRDAVCTLLNAMSCTLRARWFPQDNRTPAGSEEVAAAPFAREPRECFAKTYRNVVD